MKSSFLRLGVTAILAGVLVIAFSHQTGPSSDAAKAILEGIRKLRSLPDSDRVGATKSLALEIRALPASKEKLSLASSLTNLSTEGDFGKDTLQEVTNTLVLAMKETPPERREGKPAYQYSSLAQLAIYEHMKVDLDNEDYRIALTNLAALNEQRAKVDFALTDLTGKNWKLSDLKGKVVVVNFWATWCPPCRKEMPDLNVLHNRFKDKGLVILAISDETLDKVKPFIDEKKYDFPILLDPERKVNSLYQVDGIPKSFFYNREGKLVTQSIDMRTMGQFLELLKVAGIEE